jgi:WD40 repeat protein
MAPLVAAQTAPSVVWQIPTPGLLGNSVQAVAWSPTGDGVSVGSTDRWFRLRRPSDGQLLYSILEPQHSHGVGHIVYSTDGALIGVRNQSSGLSFRVQRASDGAFLGNVIATVGANGIVTFAPDAGLLASTGGDGTISSWRFSDLTMYQVTGSGYDKVTTAFNFSPDGTLQTAASRGSILVQRRSDGAVIRALRRAGSTVVFSPNSDLLAAWSFSPINQIVLWRTSDWTIVNRMVSENEKEGLSALRFSPDGSRLVSTGYSPYLDAQGLWQQKGFIRFFAVASGAVLWNFDDETDLGVTSPVTWSPDGTMFGYGLYNGTVAVALTPP